MMSAERGASDNTLQSYRRDLEDAAERLPAGIAEAGAADLRVYLADIAGRGFASSSQARKLSTLRQFFKFLYAEGLRTDDPTGTLDSPRKDRLAAQDHERGRDRPAARPRREGSGAAAPAMPRMPHGVCMRWSSCSTRPACASPSWSRCR